MKFLTGPAGQPGSRRALLMLAAGGTLTAMLWVLSDPPPTEAVAAVERSRPAAERPHDGLAFGFVQREASKVSANLFGRHSWYVAPPPPPPAAPAPPPAPTAPPLPFSVLGSYASAGGQPVYFLVRGDRVYDVHVGDVIDNTYSIDGVSNGRLNLTYLPLKIVQSLPVGNSP